MVVMSPAPWGEALDAVLRDDSVLVIPTPSGRTFTQPWSPGTWPPGSPGVRVQPLRRIDARVAAHYAHSHGVLEVSIGDYVLAGGEAATLVMCEAVVRLLPGSWATRSRPPTTPSFQPSRRPTRGPGVLGPRCGGGSRSRSFCPGITRIRRGAMSGRSGTDEFRPGPSRHRSPVPRGTLETIRQPPATGDTLRSRGQFLREPPPHTARSTCGECGRTPCTLWTPSTRRTFATASPTSAPATPSGPRQRGRG